MNCQRLAVLTAGLIYCFVAQAMEVLKADKIVVNKGKRELLLYRDNEVVKSYRIALGRNPAGPKRRQGDGKTREGAYTISGRNAKSAFFKSLRISYPSAAGRIRARKQGVDPGGDIMIHGLPNGQGSGDASHLATDWTEGCIAVTNDEIQEIWEMAGNGTPIQINP
ncbi:MAG: L,D-transpeptidase family protein [Bryobacteraceae bacterium]